MSNQKDTGAKQSQAPVQDIQKNRLNTNRSDRRNRPDRDRRKEFTTQQKPDNSVQNSSGNPGTQKSNPRRDNNRYTRGGTSGTEQQNEQRVHSERPNTRPAIGPAKLIKKRVETVDDIRLDIERVESDIQFEIMQIQTTKLGM